MIKNEKVIDSKDKQELICGLIMPISGSEHYSEQHWVEVKKIIEIAVNKAKFEINLVSDAIESGTIMKRIVQNLYDNPIVICDVSSKNPNVMFELGLRLAFDKPTIIIKDDKTGYSFDIGGIEHLTYTKSLHYQSVLDFIEKLSEKIIYTYDASKQSDTYTTFLGHFGEYQLSTLDSQEISGKDLLTTIMKVQEEMVSLNNKFLNSSKKQEVNQVKYINHYPESEIIRPEDLPF